jgi:hypothetical protein
MWHPEGFSLFIYIKDRIESSDLVVARSAININKAASRGSLLVDVIDWKEGTYTRHGSSSSGDIWLCRAPFKERAFICRCSLSGFTIRKRWATASNERCEALFAAFLLLNLITRSAGRVRRSNTRSRLENRVRKTHSLIMKYHFLSVPIVNTAQHLLVFAWMPVCGCVPPTITLWFYWGGRDFCSSLFCPYICKARNGVRVPPHCGRWNVRG